MAAAHPASAGSQITYAIGQLVLWSAQPGLVDAQGAVLLVAAYLAGRSVSVPEGEDVGGQFQNVPVCKANDQTGCVISWASFRADAPPVAGSFFGRPVAGSRSGGAEQPEGQVAVCANPADLAGGVGASEIGRAHV